MGPVEVMKSTKKRRKFDNSMSFKLDKIDITDLVLQVHAKMSLKLNVWFILI
jgi:hypothetical protein